MWIKYFSNVIIFAYFSDFIFENGYSIFQISRDHESRGLAGGAPLP